jgi:sec-independent protein translocase protein TatB
MFDIGFTELVLVAVVGLLVIGPERLPGTIRTASVWLNRLKRGFNDIKREVQQELHNDEVMQGLRTTGQQIKSQADNFTKELNDTAASLAQPPADGDPAGPTDNQATGKNEG